MNIYKFSDGSYVNLDAVETAFPLDRDADGKVTTLAVYFIGQPQRCVCSADEFAKALDWARGNDNPDTRRLVDALNRLTNAIPHSLRMHL